MALDFELLNKRNKEIKNEYRISYFGFGALRQSLAHHISEDFKYHYKSIFELLMFKSKQKEHEYWLNKYYDDNPKQQPIIDSLFFHSDCDGEWKKEEIDILVEWLETHKPIEQPDKDKRDYIEEYQGLLKMLKTPKLNKVIFC